MRIVVAYHEVAGKTHGFLTTAVRTPLVWMFQQKTYCFCAKGLLQCLVRHFIHDERVVFKLLSAAPERTAHLLVCNQFVNAKHLKERWFHDEPLLQNM